MPTLWKSTDISLFIRLITRKSRTIIDLFLCYPLLLSGRGGGGGTWVNVSGCASGLSVPLALYSLFLANYNPHLSHFLENVIFAIPTLSLSIFCTSTLSIWFQAAECNAVNASLLLNLINNNFLIF